RTGSTRAWPRRSARTARASRRRGDARAESGTPRDRPRAGGPERCGPAGGESVGVGLAREVRPWEAVPRRAGGVGPRPPGSDRALVGEAGSRGSRGERPGTGPRDGTVRQRDRARVALPRGARAVRADGGRGARGGPRGDLRAGARRPDRSPRGGPRLAAPV